MEEGGCYSWQKLEFTHLSIKDAAPSYKHSGEDGTDAENHKKIPYRFNQTFQVRRRRLRDSILERGVTE
jgi:hypothetical protein